MVIYRSRDAGHSRCTAVQISEGVPTIVRGAISLASLVATSEPSQRDQDSLDSTVRMIHMNHDEMMCRTLWWNRPRTTLDSRHTGPMTGPLSHDLRSLHSRIMPPEMPPQLLLLPSHSLPAPHRARHCSGRRTVMNTAKSATRTVS